MKQMIFKKIYIHKAIINSIPVILIFYLFLNHSTPSLAQDTIVRLTLQDAVELARQQSPDALIAKHTFLASYWQFRSYQASYLPSLHFDGNLPNYNREYISQYQPETGGTEFYPINENELMGSLSLRQLIGPTGGSLSLSSDLRRIDNFFSDSSYYQSSLINITYVQPLFQYNSLKWERKTEPLKYKEAKKKYIEDMEQVAITANNHFFNLLLAQIEKEVAIINQANYDTLYKIAKGRYNLGKIAENDLLQLELRYLRANSNVKEKELNFENELFRFKSYLRIKDDDKIELIIPDDIKHFTVEYARAIEQARYNNSTVLGFQRRLLEAESEVAVARFQNRFDANLVASYGLNNSRQYIPQLNDNPSDLRGFTLGVSIPILDWGVARGNIKKAESNRELVITAVEQEQIDFDQQVFLLVSRFNMQYQQVLIAAKADTVAQKGYDVTKARYLIGKISITDLNIAQTESNNSKGSYINTLSTYWRNYYELRRLTLYDFELNLPITVDYTELL